MAELNNHRVARNTDALDKSSLSYEKETTSETTLTAQEMKESGSGEEEPMRKRRRYFSDTGTRTESGPRLEALSMNAVMSNNALMDRLLCNHQLLKHTRSFHERLVNKNLRLREMPETIEVNMRPLGLLGPMSNGLAEFQIDETNLFLKVANSEKNQYLDLYYDLHRNFDYNLEFLKNLARSMNRDVNLVDDANRDDLFILIDLTDFLLVETKDNQRLIKNSHDVFLENYLSIESNMKALVVSIEDDVDFTRRNVLHRLASSHLDLVNEMMKCVVPWTTHGDSLKSIYETTDEILREYIFIINDNDETISIETMMNEHVTNKSIVQRAKREYIVENCWDGRPRMALLS